MKIQNVLVGVLVTVLTTGCSRGNNKSGAPVCSRDTSIKMEKTDPPYELRNFDVACSSPQNSSSQDLPYNLFFVGNGDGIPYQVNPATNSELLATMTVLFMTASASRMRKACVVNGSADALEAASRMANVENIVWLGHGKDGDLVGSRGGRISPNSMRTFDSPNIRRVTFIACEAGQNRDQWKRVFAKSPRANLDLSNKDILVVKGISYFLDKYVESIVDCTDVTTAGAGD